MTVLRLTTVEGLEIQLRSEILTGELSPGTRLREVELSDRFGVSRNTLREALRDMASSGLVQYEPHRGVSVSEPSPDDVREVFAVRRVLEPAGLRLLDGDGVDRLAGIAHELEEAADDRDWERLSRLDITFHRTLVEAVGSPRLDRLFNSLVASLRLAFIAADSVHGRETRPHHVREHFSIVEHLQAGEPDRAERQLVRHLDDAEHLLLERMEGGG